MKPITKVRARGTGRQRTRKVTYSLPTDLLEKLDRAAGDARSRSGIVAESLARYFIEAEKRQLEAQFADAARDLLFVEDNRAVRRGFAALDAEVERRSR